MNIKKVFALLMASAMITGLLTGCGSSKENTDSGNVSETASAGSEVESTNDGKESKEPVTLTVWSAPYANNVFTEDLGNNLGTHIINEATGINTEWTVVYGASDEDRNTKFNLMLSSGEYPDVILYSPFTRNSLYEAAQEGIVIPLNDLIENHTVNLKKLFAENPDLLKGIAAPDGNIYGLGSFMPVYHNGMSNRIWIYTPWLEKLDLEMPTTTEEYLNVLRAFCNEDPNGNGQKDEIGLITMNNATLRHLLSSFLYWDGTNLEVADGKVNFVANTEAYREGLRYLATMYKEGLVPQDVFSMDDTQRKALNTNPGDCLVGSLYSYWKGGDFNLNEEGDRGMDYDILLPLEGPEGLRQAISSPDVMSPNCFSITSSCEDPVAAIQWIDWIFDIENSLTLHTGPQLEHSSLLSDSPDKGNAGWWLPEEGEYDQTGAAPLYGYFYGDGQNYIGTEYEGNFCWGMDVGPMYRPLEVHNGFVAYTDEGAPDNNTLMNGILYQVTEQAEPYRADAYRSYKNCVLFNTPEGIASIAEYEAQIKPLVDQWRAEFITGVKNLDTDWEAYLKELDALDVTGYVEVLQSEYDFANPQ